LSHSNKPTKNQKTTTLTPLCGSNKTFHLTLVFLSDLKKLGKFSPQSDEQPCDLRLFTPATCLIEFRNAAAAAAGLQAQVQNLSQAASSVLTNNSSQASSTIGPSLSSSQQIPFIKNLGLLPRSSLTSSQREHGERDKTRLSSSSSNQMSPLSLTPIHSMGGGGGAPYSCSRCGNTYARPHSLNRHIRFECGKTFFFFWH
jgi:hypothetical protein